MKQTEYRVVIHSITRFLIAFIVIFIAALYLINEYTPRVENKVLSILQFVAIMVGAFYLAHLIGKAKAIVQLTDEGVQHIWERRFLFSWEKNLSIPWDIVDNYVFQEDRTFDSFIINLTTNKRYKINQLNLIAIKDDFAKLVEDFPHLSNQFREEKGSDNQVAIKKGKTIYESKGFRWVYYVMLAGFGFLLVMKLVKPETASTWSALGVIGFGVLFYGAMIFRKK